MTNVTDNLMTMNGPSVATLPAVLDEDGLFDLLRMASDPEWLAYLVQRRGLTAVTFKRDGRCCRRFPTAAVLRWLVQEAMKRTTDEKYD